MLDPSTRSRSDLRSGTPIVLADGQEWILPGPDATVPVGPARLALLDGIVEAEDLPSLLRAELALGIDLILSSYDLPPLSLGTLLDFREDEAASGRFRAVLHEAALAHVRAGRKPASANPEGVPSRRVSRWTGFFGRLGTSASH